MNTSLINSPFRLFDKFVEQFSALNDRAFYWSVLRVYAALHIFRNAMVHMGTMDISMGPESLFPFYYQNSFLWFFKAHYYYFAFLQMFVAVLFLFGIGKRFTAIVLFSTVELFNTYCPYLINGGDNLLKFVVLYLIFADSYQYFSIKRLTYKNERNRQLSTFLTNLSSYTLMGHLCLIYFVSGIEKAHADPWYNGIALYYILNLERFTGTSFNHWLSLKGWFVNLATYAVLLWELYFPVLVWLKRTRFFMLVFGVAVHLGILTFMMLYDFQILFIVIYGMFFTDKEWFAFFDKLRAWKTAILTRFKTSGMPGGRLENA